MSDKLAVQACLANARLARDEGREKALAYILEEGPRIASTEDAREGMMSLMEKRPPKFTGK